MAVTAAFAVSANAQITDGGFETQGASVASYCYFGADCPAHAFHHSTILIQIRKNLLLKNISKLACQAPIPSIFCLTGAITGTYLSKIVGVTVMVNGVQ